MENNTNFRTVALFLLNRVDGVLFYKLMGFKDRSGYTEDKFKKFIENRLEFALIHNEFLEACYEEIKKLDYKG